MHSLREREREREPIADISVRSFIVLQAVLIVSANSVSSTRDVILGHLCPSAEVKIIDV